MKKYGKLIVAAAVLLCGMIFTGCDEIKEEFEGPKDKWLTKEIDYNSEKFTISGKATVYLYYTDEDSPSIEELNDDITLKKGLNIILVPQKPTGNGTVSTLYTSLETYVNSGDTPYVVYNLPKGKAIEEADDESDSSPFKITMSDTVWNSFCTINQKTKSTATTDTPYPLKSNGFSKINASLEQLKAIFSWKELLIMLLSF